MTTYVTFCDNAAVAQLSQQLPACKARRTRLSTRAAWLHRLVHFEHISVQYAPTPTNYQRADILTKGLSADLHEAARKELRLHVMVCNRLFMDFIPSEEAAEHVNDNSCFLWVVLRYNAATSHSRMTWCKIYALVS